jgi:uncharacterized Ntn-hydrolase superfamily protein
MARTVATYSIAACDLEAGQWGVATQSKFLAVGSVVPWAEPGVGGIATQAYANPRYGPEGLALLREGLSAEEVVERLTSADEGRAERQLGIVTTWDPASPCTSRRAALASSVRATTAAARPSAQPTRARRRPEPLQCLVSPMFL